MRIVMMCASMASACNLCDEGWLFVVSTGRSGSTTVQQMLNALPQVYMAGENGGVLSGLVLLTRPYHFHTRNHTANETSWWRYADPNQHAILCDLQRYVRDLLTPADNVTGRTRYIGFKEIRYEIFELELMRNLFPCGKFIVNWRRNITDLKRSRKVAFVGNEAGGFGRRNRLFERFAASLGNRSFSLPLESMSLDTFQDMRRWLGVSGCAYTDVYHYNINGGYEPGGHARSPADVLDSVDDCRFTGF